MQRRVWTALAVFVAGVAESSGSTLERVPAGIAGPPVCASSPVAPHGDDATPCARLRQARAAQDPPLPNAPRVHVSCGTSSTVVAEAQVWFEATGSAPAQGASTGACGWAWFPALAADGAQRILRIDRPGYLPYRAQIAVQDARREMYRALVPADGGFETPLIQANRGGRFELEGLGVLRVAPNALQQNVKLRLVPVPEVAWSDLVTDGGRLCYQVWLTASDAAGSPAHHVLPGIPGSLSLEIPIPSDHVVPEGAVQESWVAHCLGSFEQDESSVAQAGTDTLIMPLGRGHNCLYHTYAVPTEGLDCRWGPWRIRSVLIGQRVVPDGPSVPVICGVITTTCEYKVGGSTVVENEIEFEETDTRRYGIRGKSPIVASVSMENGFTTRYKASTNTVETVTKEQRLGANYGETISGQPVGNQPPGFDCISGVKRHGVLFRKFQVEAYRFHTCGLPPETQPLAIFEVYSGFTTWYEGPNGQPFPLWDASCASGCTPPGTMPPSIPLRPQ